MTEDDTFNRLKRTPFRELFVSLLDPIKLGMDIIPANRNSAIVAAGWTVDEFRDVMYSELVKGNITNNATIIATVEWRAEFLKKEKIY